MDESSWKMHIKPFVCRYECVSINVDMCDVLTYKENVFNDWMCKSQKSKDLKITRTNGKRENKYDIGITGLFEENLDLHWCITVFIKLI